MKATFAEGLPGHFGLVEWFRPGEYDRVEQVLKDMKRIGASRIRTGISWADWYTPEGEAWYDWLVPRLASEVELLPCVLYTPPSIGVEEKSPSPPRRPKDYADFIDLFVNRHGKHFEYVELWNEPNNLSEWDWTLDPHWTSFGEMIGCAAYWAKQTREEDGTRRDEPDRRALALPDVRTGGDGLHRRGRHPRLPRHLRLHLEGVAEEHPDGAGTSRCCAGCTARCRR